MSDVCRHTGKPHRWFSLGKVTRHRNGRVIDWHQCRGCGLIVDRDAPAGHA